MSTEQPKGQAPPHPSHTRVLDYALVDVFAERPLEGNMLAIFPDARGLSTAQMQALARETNLSETAFVLPAGPDPAALAREAAQGVQVRIFTVQEELPFAGHPTLGTAAWLHWNYPRLRQAETITLALEGGPVRVAFRMPQHDEIPAPGVFATMQQRDPLLGPTHAPHEVADALGLAEEDLDPSLPVQTVSTGIAFCIVPLRTVSALRRLAIVQARAQAWLAGAGAKFFYCITAAEADSTADFLARMQFYNGEDPATGSAAGCAIAYLVEHGVVPPETTVLFEQGVEIARPSRLHVQAGKSGGRIHRVFVGGRTIPVATGRFFLP